MGEGSRLAHGHSELLGPIPIWLIPRRINSGVPNGLWCSTLSYIGKIDFAQLGTSLMVFNDEDGKIFVKCAY